MDSIIYLYDGSFEGLLHAVAAAVKSGQGTAGIYVEKDYLPQLFDTIIRIRTDKPQAARLFDYLQSLEGQAARFALHGFLSEDREAGLHLYRMVQECLARGSCATSNFTHDSIRYLEQLSRKVGGEAHRLMGLIRFRILQDGLLYAPVEPDHNVIGYCADHFRKRLAGQRWILHDVRRNQALYWDGRAMQEIAVDDGFTSHVRSHGEIPDDHLTSGERQYQGLWKSFHGAIANKDRTNLHLQCRLMPRRYWKYLVEMKD